MRRGKFGKRQQAAMRDFYAVMRGEEPPSREAREGSLAGENREKRVPSLSPSREKSEGRVPSADGPVRDKP